MKWGVRRYQNYDGTLTAEGRRHTYSSKDFDKVGKAYGASKNTQLKEAYDSIDDEVNKTSSKLSKAYADFYKSNDTKEGRSKLIKEYCKENGYDSPDEMDPDFDRDNFDVFMMDKTYDSKGVKSARKEVQSALDKAQKKNQEVVDKALAEAKADFAETSVKDKKSIKSGSDAISRYINTSGAAASWMNIDDIEDYADEDLDEKYTFRANINEEFQQRITK